MPAPRCALAALVLLTARALPTEAQGGQDTSSRPRLAWPAGDSSAAPAPPAARRWALATPCLVEVQYSMSALDRRSPLNPQNVARIPTREVESRLFPQIILRRGDTPLVRAEARVRGRRATGDSAAADAELQELFLGRALTSGVYVAVGRQRLGWGTALVANPTRLEAQRDAFRGANRLRGADVGRVEWLRGDWAANAVIAPSRRPERSLGALRVERTAGQAALSVTLTTRAGRDWRVGADVARPDGAATWYAEGTLSGWAERPAWSFLGDPHHAPPPLDAASGDAPVIRHGQFADVVAGVAWLPAPALRVVAEYRYQSDYASRAEFARFVAALPRDYARYDPLGQGRHRMFASLRAGDSRRLAGTIAAFADPVTRQLLLMPAIERGGDHVQLEVTSLSFVEDRRVAALRHRTFAVLSVFF